MNSFFKYLFGLTAISICLAIILYTLVLVFFHEYHKRSKVDVSNSTANVVFFGSSRCVNTVVPSVFDSVAGTDSYNMGWAASGPREIYAAVKLYLAKNYPPKYALLQLDLSHDITSPSDLARQSLLKYYFTSEIEDYYDDSIKNQMCIPLLPNILNRDFGWREVLKTIVRNRDASNVLNGYAPIYGELGSESFHQNLHDSEFAGNEENTWTLKSIQLLQNNGVQVILFTAPYYNYSHSEIFNRLEMYDLPYFNLSNSILRLEYFSDHSHVNDSGAHFFTDSLARRFQTYIQNKGNK
jgi:hypothetical protein